MRRSVPGILYCAAPFLSCLLLAAHFLRAGALGIALAWILLTGLLWLRRAWGRPVLQILLVLGMLVWTSTAADLIRIRMAFGQPWMRTAFILGVVAVFTGTSALLLESPTLRDRFSRNREASGVQAGAFLLTLLALSALHSGLPFPILLVERLFPGFGPVQILGMAGYAAWIGAR